MGTLSAYKLKLAYGVSKSELRSAMMSYFHLPHVYDSCLIYRAISRISGVTLKRNVREGLLRINSLTPIAVELERKDFAIVYQDCNFYTASRAIELILSWRAAYDDFGLHAIVIVRIEQENKL